MRKRVIIISLILMLLISSACISNGTSSNQIDTDNDGWTDAFEIKQGTDPANPDTDGDGIIDSKDPEPLVAEKKVATTTPPPTTTPTPTTTAPPTTTPSPTTTSPPTTTPTPTTTVPPTTTPAPTTLPPSKPSYVFSDSFDSNVNDWPMDSRSDDYATIKQSLVNGKYRWDVKAHKGVNWHVYPTNIRTFTDLHLTVEAQQISGANAAYGAVFRLIDGDNFYLFEISNTQKYIFMLQYKDEWISLIDWTTSSAIRPEQVNKIEVIAEGSHFSFLINDKFIDDVYDDRLTSGKTGLAIELYNAGDTDVFEFDNFELTTAIPTITTTPQKPQSFEGTLSSIDSDMDMIRDGHHTSWWTPNIHHTAPEGKSGAKLDFSRAGHVLLRGPEKRVEKVTVTDPLFIYFTPGTYEFAYYTPEVNPLYGTFDFKEGKTYNWQAIIK